MTGPSADMSSKRAAGMPPFTRAGTLRLPSFSAYLDLVESGFNQRTSIRQPGHHPLHLLPARRAVDFPQAPRLGAAGQPA
ncbi:MAG: hypothetical protein ACLSVD_09330 [Eggerthellaceae bacterium]